MSKKSSTDSGWSQQEKDRMASMLVDKIGYKVAREFRYMSGKKKIILLVVAVVIIAGIFLLQPNFEISKTITEFLVNVM